MINPSPLLDALTIPFGMVIFLLVWLVAHVVNVLILISPFGIVDAALKSARLFVLSLLAGLVLDKTIAYIPGRPLGERIRQRAKWGWRHFMAQLQPKPRKRRRRPRRWHA